MKSMIALCLTIVSLEAFEYHLVPKEVAKGVHCFFGTPEEITKENGGNMVNTCFVTTKEGFVVIDSGPTYIYAEQAYSAMQKIANLPVKYVIDTHDHDDHWLGNGFYTQKGALLMGSRTYEQNVQVGMPTRMEKIVSKETFAKTKIVKLNRVIESEHNLTLGGTEFQIKQLVTKAHTKGDLVVSLPQNKVLFVGDLVFNDRITSLRDGSVIGSLKAIEMIEAIDADVIITGHGYVTDKTAVKHQKEYLLALKEGVQDAIDNDISIDEVTKRVKLEQFKDMNLYKELNSRNVFEAYRELEFYEEEDE